MIIRPLHIIAILFISFGFFSCEKDNTLSINYNIEEEFNIGIIEKLESNSKSIQLSVETIKSTYCPHSHIGYGYNFFEASNRIEVDLLNVEEDQNCNDKDYNANAIIDLGDLPNGEYDLVINLANTVPNVGALNITDYNYTLTVDPDLGLLVPHKVINKIPEKTIWGFVGFSDVEQAVSGAASIMGEIKNNFDNGFQLPVGNYGHFEFKDGEMNFDYQSNFSNSFTFIMSTNEELEKVENFVNDLKSSNTLVVDGKIELIFYDSEGNIF